jgi:hypothetical protein
MKAPKPVVLQELARRDVQQVINALGADACV